MPRLLFEFRCQAGHEVTEFVNTETYQIDCPDCGEPAKRLISKPKFPLRQGVDVDMPTAAARWAKVQRAKNSGRIKDSNNSRYGYESD